MVDVAVPLQSPSASQYLGADEILLARRAAGDTANRWEQRADGRQYVGPGNAAPTLSLGDFSFRPPTSGQFTGPAELAQTTLTMATQQLAVTLFVPEITQLVSNIQVYVGGTAAAATPTIIRFGIYTISGTTATLAISTPNDTTLLAATNALSGRAVTTPATIVRGTSYFLAALVVTAVAAPILAARAGGAAVSTAAQDSINGSGLRTGVIASQADLPATFTTTNITATATSALWAWLT